MARSHNCRSTRGNTLMGLLTSETVARWHTAQLADGQGILEERPVEEFTRHEEGTHSDVVMGRSATIDDALSLLNLPMHTGKTLAAIFMIDHIIPRGKGQLR